MFRRRDHIVLPVNTGLGEPVLPMSTARTQHHLCTLSGRNLSPTAAESANDTAPGGDANNDQRLQKFQPFPGICNIK
jgi:hypothetical protein